jgi:hypothetical protein
MKLRGVRMDETHALMLLRICYNRLRQAWVPGGYPPNRPTGGAGSGGFTGARQSPLRQRLLEALTPRGREVELREQPVDVAWESQAFSIYREAVAAGVKPSMRMLNRMLMCLRVAWEGNQVCLAVLSLPCAAEIMIQCLACASSKLRCAWSCWRILFLPAFLCYSLRAVHLTCRPAPLPSPPVPASAGP